jgi:hypothetical protein
MTRTPFFAGGRIFLLCLGGLGLALPMQAQRIFSQRDMLRDPPNLALMEASIHPGFSNDVFTFARLFYSGYGGRGGGRGYQDDMPNADWNIQWRLFQVTSLKIYPREKVIEITPEDLARYPFVYVTATDAMNFSDAQSTALRKYLLNGGFLMAEDFWGDRSWIHVQTEFRKIFPTRALVELPLSHPIFHGIFDFKYLPQIPSAGPGTRGNDYDNADYGSGDHFPHYYAVYDDKKRMMAIVCRNNHYGDGWEHEGDTHEYFDNFSEPQAYPMFINILYYSMTH